MCQILGLLHRVVLGQLLLQRLQSLVFVELSRLIGHFQSAEGLGISTLAEFLKPLAGVLLGLFHSDPSFLWSLLGLSPVGLHLGLAILRGLAVLRRLFRPEILLKLFDPSFQLVLAVATQPRDPRFQRVDGTTGLPTVKLPYLKLLFDLRYVFRDLSRIVLIRLSNIGQDLIVKPLLVCLFLPLLGPQLLAGFKLVVLALGIDVFVVTIDFRAIEIILLLLNLAGIARGTRFLTTARGRAGRRLRSGIGGGSCRLGGRGRSR